MIPTAVQIVRNAPRRIVTKGIPVAQQYNAHMAFVVEHVRWAVFLLRQMTFCRRDLLKGTRSARECARHLAEAIQEELRRTQ